MTKKNNENLLNAEFIEKVVKFIKYDDLIKKEKEEYKNAIMSLECEKKKLEIFLIEYLQSKDKDIINMQNDILKIIKYNKKF